MREIPLKLWKLKKNIATWKNCKRDSGNQDNVWNNGGKCR